MELLGHSQISLTMETYSHVLPDAMQEAVARFGVLLSRTIKHVRSINS